MAVGGRGAHEDPRKQNYTGNYTTSLTARDKNEYVGGQMHSK